MVNGLVLNPNWRKTTYCSNNDVETECYVLITCTKYSDLRSDLFNVAKDLIINFDDLSSECKFITILESDETSLVQQLAKCIYHIFITPCSRFDNTLYFDITLTPNGGIVLWSGYI